LLVAGAAELSATHSYPVTGLIVSVDRAHRTFTASCTEIPGYMGAMVMPIAVRNEEALDGLQPSVMVDFNLIVTESDSYADDVRIHLYRNLEQEPLQVRRLQLLAGLTHKDALPRQVALGDGVPDFTLTDQTGKSVSLAQFAGKVVAAAFFYAGCPLPNYCFRLSNNLARVRKRFSDHMGRDLILLSITMDPVHDTPESLAKYANTWRADSASWHFLTGPTLDVQRLCGWFGVNFWPDEGTLAHSLHTIVIDRDGKLAANFEGNEFTAEQLGDFVQAVLDQR
jgi:protein SCO1/2